jgi:predicted transcriptional regulator
MLPCCHEGGPGRLMLLENGYVFHGVDTSLENSVSQEFRNICADNNISYYKKPENTSTSSQPGQIVSAAVQWTCDNLILDSHKNDIVCSFDSDMPLIDKFDFGESLTHEEITGVPQKRE